MSTKIGELVTIDPARQHELFIFYEYADMKSLMLEYTNIHALVYLRPADKFNSEFYDVGLLTFKNTFMIVIYPNSMGKK